MFFFDMRVSLKISPNRWSTMGKHGKAALLIDVDPLSLHFGGFAMFDPFPLYSALRSRYIVIPLGSVNLEASASVREPKSREPEPAASDAEVAWFNIAKGSQCPVHHSIYIYIYFLMHLFCVHN